MSTIVNRAMKSAGKTDHEVAASYGVRDAAVRHLNRWIVRPAASSDWSR